MRLATNFLKCIVYCFVITSFTLQSINENLFEDVRQDRSAHDPFAILLNVAETDFINKFQMTTEVDQGNVCAWWSEIMSPAAPIMRYVNSLISKIEQINALCALQHSSALETAYTGHYNDVSILAQVFFMRRFQEAVEQLDYFGRNIAQKTSTMTKKSILAEHLTIPLFPRVTLLSESKHVCDLLTPGMNKLYWGLATDWWKNVKFASQEQKQKTVHYLHNYIFNNAVLAQSFLNDLFNKDFLYLNRALNESDCVRSLVERDLLAVPARDIVV